MITERLMAAGSWDVTLVPETPGHIRDALTWFGHVSVLPGWVPNISVAADVLDRAIYTGIYQGNSDRGRTLEGYGLANHLGPRSDFITANSSDAQTFATHIRTSVLRHASDRLNGITEGTLGAGATSKTIDLNQGDQPLEILNFLCTIFGNEWRINPDGTLDAANASVVFGTDPVAILTPWWGGRDLTLPGYVADLQYREDVEEYTNKVGNKANNGDFVSTDVSATDVYLDFNGVGLTRGWWNTSTSAPDLVEAQVVRDADLARLQTIRRELSATLRDVFAPSQEIKPGEYVAVYDPDQNLWDSTATAINYRGQLMFPLVVRCVAINWPVQQGMGVYFIDSTSSLTVTDLTPYIQWEDGPARLELGAPPRTLDVL